MSVEGCFTDEGEEEGRYRSSRASVNSVREEALALRGGSMLELTDGQIAESIDDDFWKLKNQNNYRK